MNSFPNQSKEKYLLILEGKAIVIYNSEKIPQQKFSTNSQKLMQNWSILTCETTFIR